MSQTYFKLVPRSKPSLVSLVIPVFNEVEVLPELKKELTILRNKWEFESEIVFVNDGSSDPSMDILDAWAKEDQDIKVIHFSKNFGHQIAVTAGLDYANGEAVVILDADLQDPPALVPDMIELYCKGFDVVYGKRVEREGETLFKKLSAWLFYRAMSWFVHKDLPNDAGDFRLLSRKCIDSLIQMREMHRFLRGMVTWVGFAQTDLPYKRSARAAGSTKYPLKKMIKFAWTAAISFSPLPLRMSLSFGVLVAIFGFLNAFYAIFCYIQLKFFSSPIFYMYSPGWTTLVSLVCIIGGAILISIGILGEYVGKVFEEIKDRPVYIVDRKINL